MTAPSGLLAALGLIAIGGGLFYVINSGRRVLIGRPDPWRIAESVVGVLWVLLGAATVAVARTIA